MTESTPKLCALCEAEFDKDHTRIKVSAQFQFGATHDFCSFACLQRWAENRRLAEREREAIE